MATDPRLTPEEVEYLEHELYERLKDVLYINGKQIVKDMVEMARDTIWDTPQTEAITFNISVEMVRGDLLQIIGRQRREMIAE